MNKRILFLIAACALTFALRSQTTVNALYQDFAHETNVTKVNLNGVVMALARPFLAKHTSSRITGISVLSLDDCPHHVKERFNNRALDFNDKNYELFVNSNDDDEKVRVFLRFHKNAIREMVVMTLGDSPALIRLKGKIKPSDIENLSKNNGQR